ncbi:hypothetical protein B0H19DRAFT_1102473 [Mycena capillaripes]|nr:hypothetical protein B0H19DRAFT_1102473 [Mycena capillaripes]
MRYTVPLQMIIHTMQLAGLSDVHFSDAVRLTFHCKTWYPTALILGGLTFGINDCTTLST